MCVLVLVIMATMVFVFVLLSCCSCDCVFLLCMFACSFSYKLCVPCTGSETLCDSQLLATLYFVFPCRVVCDRRDEFAPGWCYQEDEHGFV